MRKTFSKVLAALMVLSLLTGCGNSDRISVTDDIENTETDTDEKTEEKTETATEAASGETDTGDNSETDTDDDIQELDGDSEIYIDYDYYWDVYRPVLEEIYNAINDGYDYEKEYTYLSTGIIEEINYGEKEELLDTIGYLLKDVNGDTIPELIIGKNETDEDGNEDSIIFCGFTYESEKITIFLDGWARSYYRWMYDNHFFYSGSGGASYSAFGECHLKYDKPELEWDKFYFTDEVDGNIEFYQNTTGEWDSEKSEKMDISDDDFLALREGLKTMPGSWTEIGFYPDQYYEYIEENGTDTSDNSQTTDTSNETDSSNAVSDITISVAYEDEMTDMPTQYLTYEPDDRYEYTVNVFFSTNKEVKNFKLVDLVVKNIDDDGNIEYQYTEKFSLDKLTPDTPLLAGLNFIGDMPNNGFMYTDDSGKEHLFVLGQSGMDGSLITWEY